MLDSVFSPSLVRGFTTPLQPPPSPTGLGQGQPSLPRGMQIVPPQGRDWLVAYVEGAGRPRIYTGGNVGFSYGKACRFFAHHYGAMPIFFQFKNDAGTYLFAHEIINGRGVIKIADVKPTMQGKRIVAIPKRAPGTKPHSMKRASNTGMGQVFMAQPSSYDAGTKDFIPLPGPPTTCTGWYEVYPKDNFGIAANTNLSGDMGDILSTAQANKSAKSGEFLYFGWSDPTEGAAYTAGEPGGMSIMRYSVKGGQPTVGICYRDVAGAPSGTTMPPVPGEGGGGSVGGGGGGSGGGGVIVVSPNPCSTLDTTNCSDPPPGVVTWWVMRWVYMTTGGYPPPTTPPTGADPSGSWVQTRPDHWVWYPAPGQTVPLNGYYVYSDSTKVPGDLATRAALSNPWFQTLAMPMTTPAGVTGGAWKSPSPDYWVYETPTPMAGAPMATTTDYTWLWVVLGLAATGTVAYFIFD